MHSLAMGFYHLLFLWPLHMGPLRVSFFLKMLHHPGRLSSLAMRATCAQKDLFHGSRSVLALSLPLTSLPCKWEQDFPSIQAFLGGGVDRKGVLLCPWALRGRVPQLQRGQLQGAQKGTVPRSWQDSNLRGETPMDF